MKYTTSILALAASASAHMILNYPKPYGNPNNSPLDNSGSDFPCKATGPESYTASTMNEWNAGETKQVSFTGSAVHGGGSCQFSLTTDKAPTKNTQWKVIHSVIGGCPATAEGNLGNDPNGSGASKFDVTLPSDLPAGEYTFAWTWFNKIGNREMYMNCAPLKVGGGGSASTSDASGALSKLPDMFVANLPREQCATSDSQDVVFPDPGDSVEKGSQMIAGSVAGSGCASMTKMGAGSGNMGSPSQPTDGPVASEPAASQPAATTPPASPAGPTAVPSNPGGVFAPGASSAAPAPSAAPTGAPSQPGNSTPPASGGSGTPCTNEGAIVCIGSNQFGLCNQGVAVPQALAAGTTCSNGQISKRSVRRFPRAALHRRHGSNLI